MEDCDSGRMTMSEEDFKVLYNKYFPEGDSDKFATYVFQHLGIKPSVDLTNI